MRASGGTLRRLLCSLVLVCVASGAQAQVDYPALHRVARVAPDDVLHVRAGPSADAEIVGSLAPDAVVEVVATVAGRPGWGMVNTGERWGHASLRFLDPLPVAGPRAPLPIVQCFGAEPFWDLRLESGAMTLRDLAPGRTLEVVDLEAPVVSIRDGRTEVRQGAGPWGRMTLVARVPEAPIQGAEPGRLCADGMSDRFHGIEATLLVEDEGGTSVLVGCCAQGLP